MTEVKLISVAWKLAGAIGAGEGEGGREREREKGREREKEKKEGERVKMVKKSTKN